MLCMYKVCVLKVKEREEGRDGERKEGREG